MHVNDRIQLLQYSEYEHIRNLLAHVNVIVGLLSAFLPRILRFYISELDSEVWQAFVEAH